MENKTITKVKQFRIKAEEVSLLKDGSDKTIVITGVESGANSKNYNITKIVPVIPCGGKNEYIIFFEVESDFEKSRKIVVGEIEKRLQERIESCKGTYTSKRREQISKIKKMLEQLDGFKEEHKKECADEKREMEELMQYINKLHPP